MRQIPAAQERWFSHVGFDAGEESVPAEVTVWDSDDEELAAFPAAFPCEVLSHRRSAIFDF